MKTLVVYGFNLYSVELEEVWRAPFKDDAALLAAFLDYSGRGFYCKVI